MERRARRALVLVLLAFSLWSTVAVVRAQDGGRPAYLIEARGPVTPVLAAYIERGIREAQAGDAACLLTVLDTPGGSLSITREIVEAMQAATVPVIVYVSPSGATAASAGTIITLAAHAAAMAPGTSIGAASPVGSQGEDLPETEKRKAENIVVADLQALTVRRGPAVQAWVEKAVRESAALAAADAAALGVVDAVADSPQQVLQALDGLTVVVAGQEVTLRTANAPLLPLPMNLVEQFLHVLLDPNIAFILMTLGINALLFELSSPGGYVSGVIGAICLLLGLFALGVLSVNWAGVGLIALAFVLFVADIKAPTHGVLTALGLLCFVLGSLVLFNSPLYRVSRTLIATVSLSSAAFFAFVITKALRAQRLPAMTGSSILVGAIGEVRQELAPRGMVLVRGELWSAVSRSGSIGVGSRVRVSGVRGLLLEVEAEGSHRDIE
ncbi:MAG: NfeD family protein [Anaerolineae bacterium]